MSPLGAALRVLTVGLLWLGAEIVVNLVDLPSASLPELFRRLLVVMPWHLAIFAGWALAAAWVARTASPTGSAVVWLAIGAGTFTFLGARVFEGLWRASGPTGAAVGVLASALAVTIGLGVLAALGRLLPSGLRRGWAPAVWIGWTLLFVLFMQRVGYEIGRARPELSKWAERFSASEVGLILAAAAGALLLFAPLRRSWLRGVGALLLLAPLAGAIAESQKPGPSAVRGSGPDVVVIVLDTMRADHLGLVRDGSSLTPALDAIAAESIRFTEAFAPSNWTRGSMPGVLASLPFRATGNAPGESVDLLAKSLQRAGWWTAGVSANPLISSRFGWAQGFDAWADPDTMGDFLVGHLLQVVGAAATGPAYRIGATSNAAYFRDAAEIRRRSAGQLDVAGRPTFLYLQMMDAHGPYLPPHRYLPPEFRWGDVSSYYWFMQLRGTETLHSEAFRAPLENFRQRYAASVRFLDDEVGHLVAELRTRGRWDETLVWVLSDHGEAFGEHDHAGHTGIELGPALIHVPLLLKTPKSWGIAPRVEPAAVSTYSVFPTTLALLDLPIPEGLFGANLAPLVRDPATAPPSGTLFSSSSVEGFDYYAAIRWPWKLVAKLEDPPLVRGLYNLVDDPAEEHSVADAHPEQVAELLAEIDAIRRRVDALSAARGAGGGVDAQTEEQLRRLGYVQ